MNNHTLKSRIYRARHWLTPATNDEGRCRAGNAICSRRQAWLDQTPNWRFVPICRMSAVGLGCVKTCAREGGAELFSLLSFPNSNRQRFGFQIDEIETKFLHANSILEFSHSQRPISDMATSIDTVPGEPQCRTVGLPWIIVTEIADTLRRRYLYHAFLHGGSWAPVLSLAPFCGV